jgi:hypothetical protein
VFNEKEQQRKEKKKRKRVNIIRRPSLLEGVKA